MTFLEKFGGTLELPLIVSPMFLVSGTESVIECCKAGVVGTFPALNHRTSEEFEQALQSIGAALAEPGQTRVPAPFGLNPIHPQTNPRLPADLKLVGD